MNTYNTYFLLVKDYFFDQYQIYFIFNSKLRNIGEKNSRFVILFDELVIICIYSKFAAAEQDDLWHYLTEQAHRDKTLPEDLTVKIIMDTWTLQMGFPGTCLKYQKI